jgi:DNA-binding winged helix-turn-helix (wHTH) protein
MAGPIYQFGPFRLDERARSLTREGEPVAITPKVFDTLVFLVSNAGRSVSRDEVIKAVWPDTFVEEGNLNTTFHSSEPFSVTQR